MNRAIYDYHDSRSDYNSVGAVLTNAYPSGYKAMNEYDALRRVSRASYFDVEDGATKTIVTYSYNKVVKL